MSHVDTSEIIRASLWLPVTDPALDRIRGASRLARQRGGGPAIKPHLTLLSGIETSRESAEQKLKRLAVRLEAFSVKLSRIDWRHEYYRCLFVTAELTEELAAAQRTAHDVFEMNPPDPFEPHVSLIYGDIDEALKRTIASELGDRLDTEFNANAVQLVRASADRAVSAWDVLAERPFGSRQPADSARDTGRTSV